MCVDVKINYQITWHHTTQLHWHWSLPGVTLPVPGTWSQLVTSRERERAFVSAHYMQGVLIEFSSSLNKKMLKQFRLYWFAQDNEEFWLTMSIFGCDVQSSCVQLNFSGSWQWECSTSELCGTTSAVPVQSDAGLSNWAFVRSGTRSNGKWKLQKKMLKEILW